MPHIKVTAGEHTVLKRALETFNDMNNDMLFEDLSIDLFPRGDQITTINANQAKQLRKELNAAYDTMMCIRSLLNKVGSKVNGAGYVVQ